ncbi:thioredoxin family protein [Desulfobotulus sp. H1]|uniref:Thioredoxin family protein n=1 Tax=Desulfobotulus pelophilus TaxID=2823377 RepID=A0ABT3N4Z2_9BACT|nr:thioredoxin family protein [Desulfobotulus pelophilus]MCW7752526.1 thioredoxin family protein [Desulfobotulus pelophilus]
MPTVRTLCICLLFLLSVSAASAAEPLTWTSYEDAKTKAASENKHIYLYFHSPQCSWCRTMETKTLANEDVRAYLNAHFIPVSIHVDRNQALADKFKVNGIPANIFLSPEGQGLFNRPGHIPPETFLRILQIIHTGRHGQ